MSGTDHVLNALEARDSRGRIDPHLPKLAGPTIAALRPLIVEVGAGGRGPQTYVVKLWRYYLGAGPMPEPLRARELAPTGEPVGDWLKVRAWEVLEAHADQLPALDWTRRPSALK